ncbi:Hypothetical protein, putative, partial [Bodo saltans]
ETERQRVVRLQQVHVDHLKQFRKKQKYHDETNSSRGGRRGSSGLDHSLIVSKNDVDGVTTRTDIHFQGKHAQSHRLLTSRKSVADVAASNLMTSSLARPNASLIPKPLFTAANTLHGKMKGGGGPLSTSARDATAVEAAAARSSGSTQINGVSCTKPGWRDGVSRPSSALDSVAVPVFSSFEQDGVFRPDCGPRLASLLDNHRELYTEHAAVQRADAEEERRQCVSALSMLTAVMTKAAGVSDNGFEQERRYYFAESALRGTAASAGSRAGGASSVIATKEFHPAVRELLKTSPRPPTAPLTGRPSSARLGGSQTSAPCGVVATARPSSARVTRSSSIVTAVDSVVSRLTPAGAAVQYHPIAATAAFLVTPPPSSLHRHEINLETQLGVFLTPRSGAVQKPQALPFRSGGTAGGVDSSQQRRRKSSVMLRNNSPHAVNGHRAAARKSFAYQLPSGQHVVAGEVHDTLDEGEDERGEQQKSVADIVGTTSLSAVGSRHVIVKKTADSVPMDLGDSNMTLTRSVVFSGSAEESDDGNSDGIDVDKDECEDARHAPVERIALSAFSAHAAASAGKYTEKVSVVSPSVSVCDNDHVAQRSSGSLRKKGSVKCVTSVGEAYEAAHVQ